MPIILPKRQILGLIVSILTLGTFLFANGDYKVRHSVFGMGGSITSSNGTRQLRSTVGEALVGKTPSQNKTASHGFWAIRFLEAEFTLSDDNGYLELNVNLADISSAYRTELTGCVWDFGDGGSLSTSAENCDTSHLFLLPDSLNTIDYTVTLTITGIYGELDVETDKVHLIRITPEFVFQFMDVEDYYPDAIIELSDTLTIDPDDLIEISTWHLGGDSLLAIAVKADEGYDYTCVQGGENFDCSNSCADYNWGDGFENGDVCWVGRSPTHRFSEYGDILITLTVTDGENAESVSHIAEVKWFLPIFQTQLNISYDPANLIQYNGDTTQLQGYVPLPVSFSDVSDTVNTYLTSCNWDFGDGTEISFTVNDSVSDCSIHHTYTEYDITNPYSVQLTVFDTSKTKTQLIERHIRVVHPFPGDSVLFVSNTGDNGASGAFGDPLETIQTAVLMAEDSDNGHLNTIVIEEGLYSENVIVLHPNLHITGYFSVDSLYDHVDSTIVDGGWQDEWPDDSDNYANYMAPYWYVSANDIPKEINGRSVFFFTNNMFTGNMDYYNPARSEATTRLTGLTVQNGIGTVLTGNWDNDNYAESKRMGGGSCILGTIAGLNYCNNINNGRKSITDLAGDNSTILKDNTNIGDVDRFNHSDAKEKFRQFLENPHAGNLFTEVQEQSPQKPTAQNFSPPELSSGNSQQNGNSSERDDHPFDYSLNFRNNYYQDNYAIIGKTFVIEAGDHEIEIDLKGSTLDYVYSPGENPAVSNYWLTKDSNVEINLENCNSLDMVLTGEIEVGSEENLDEILGKIYGGTGDEERNRLETEIVLTGSNYDTTSTTFPLQMVSNTTIRGSSENRDSWVKLNSQYTSPVVMMQEVSGIGLKNLEIKNGVSMDNGGSVSVVNSNSNHFENMRISGGLSIKRGGGIYIRNDIGGSVRDDDTTLTFSDVEVDDNDSIFEGGGIYFSNANLHIDGLEVTGNSCNNPETQYHGGGIFGEDAGSVLIENSVIHDNDASITGVAAGSWGGGIHFENVTAAMRNVQITDNKAIDKAGAIFLQDSDLNMYNCTIADNQLLQGGWGSAIHTQKSGFGGHKYLYITNSIIWNNENSIYPNSGSQLSGDFIASFGIDLYIHHTLIEGLGNLTPPNMMAYFQLELQNYGDPSNLNTDPLFSGASGNEYSLADDSPCIDAGTDYYEININDEAIVVVDIPESDYFGSDPDMGANEWTSELLGDVNGDGAIDVLDIVALVTAILNGENPSVGDMNGDGSANVIDVVIIVDIILGGNLSRGESAENAAIYYGNGFCRYDADGAIAGIQLNVSGDYNITNDYLPGGWEFVYNESTIMLYSLDGSPLENETLFEYAGDLTIISSIAADWYGSDITVSEIYIPKEFSLERAYPNPFNPVTTIQYGLPVDAAVNIIVYDLQGRIAAELTNEFKSAGYYTLHWDASAHASGIYFVKLMTPEFTKSQKLMLVK